MCPASGNPSYPGKVVTCWHRCPSMCPHPTGIGLPVEMWSKRWCSDYCVGVCTWAWKSRKIQWHRKVRTVSTLLRIGASLQQRNNIISPHAIPELSTHRFCLCHSAERALSHSSLGTVGPLSFSLLLWKSFSYSPTALYCHTHTQGWQPALFYRLIGPPVHLSSSLQFQCLF